MSSITGIVNPHIVSPHRSGSSSAATGTPAAPVDVVTISQTPQEAPPPLRAGRLVAVGLAGFAAVAGFASTAQAAGWGQSPATVSQPVQAAPSGGWGQAAPAAPAAPAPTGGWGTAVPAQPAAPQTGGWGQAVPAQPAAPQGWGPSTTAPAPSSNPQTTVNPGGGWQSSAPAVQVAGPATYSPGGTELARQALRAYDAGGSYYRNWDASNTQLQGMLQVLASVPQTTPTEKALASAALRMGEGGALSSANSAQARAAVLRVLAANPAGTTGQTLARASIEAHRALGGVAVLGDSQLAAVDHVLGVGLQAVAGSGTADEAAIGRLGYDMGNHDGVRYVNAIQARLGALNEIVTPSQGNIGNRLAIVTHNAFQAAVRWDDADRFTLDGLQAIVDHPQTSLVQKTLARLAVQSASDVGRESSARLRDTTTQNLRVIP